MSTPAYVASLHRTAPAETPALLLEISHPDLAALVRVVNGREVFAHQGNDYQPVGFEATLPDDAESGAPRARLLVDNVGRELTDWLEASYGGTGAEVRLFQVLPSEPDTVQWEVTIEMQRTAMDVHQVQADLGYENQLDQPAVRMRFDPRTAPGLF